MLAYGTNEIKLENNNLSIKQLLINSRIEVESRCISRKQSFIHTIISFILVASIKLVDY